MKRYLLGLLASTVMMAILFALYKVTGQKSDFINGWICCAVFNTVKNWNINEPS